MGLKGNIYKCKRNEHIWNTFQDQYRFQFNGINNLRLFNSLIGSINPKHKEKFSKFMDYDEKYNLETRGHQTQKIKPIYDRINLDFKKGMAAPRVELGVPSS